MRTTHVPATHTELGTGTSGKPYGHVPGHHYHDVDVVISRRSKAAYRCHVVETWGSSPGYDEEHGRKEVVGRGDSLRAAVSDARSGAESAGMDAAYLSQAISEAQDTAAEFEAEANDN